MKPYLDLQQLRAFYQLGKTGQYTKAAKALGRTQSAVSHAIRKLEEGLGVKLIAKTGREFHFTEEGEILFASCKEAFYSLDEATESISNTLGSALGKVRLGATVEFGCSILVKEMEAFILNNPRIEVDLFLSNDLLNPLLADKLDIIIDCVDHQVAGVMRTPLFQEQYAVICSPEYQKKYEINSVQDLDRCTIISLDEEGSWWRHFLYSIDGHERPSLKKNHFMTINLIRAMIIAAEHHIGVALVPRYSVIKQLQFNSLVQLFPQIRLLEDQFSIYYKTQRKKLIRHQKVVDYLTKLRPNELPKINSSTVAQLF